MRSGHSPKRYAGQELSSINEALDWLFYECLTMTREKRILFSAHAEDGLTIIVAGTPAGVEITAVSPRAEALTTGRPRR